MSCRLSWFRFVFAYRVFHDRENNPMIRMPISWFAEFILLLTTRAVSLKPAHIVTPKNSEVFHNWNQGFSTSL
ncbi:hypothetical protein NHE_0857 [Neorickettsia helminthoeca str. Oregon]|uniref:Uncharacterized protein n=1 Tax=Neorickettsia helminthoeca str. Oregon TaxID=1286528 RepID=X5GXJ3_9RICK|nr:hypothetical protein NHE_0857 [Neorickettsia helminthoeca str. Oregon]